MEGTLKPLRDGVLVRLQKPEERSAGGIIIPDVAQVAERKPAQIGMVLAVGPGAWMPPSADMKDIEFGVAPGKTARVAFQRQAMDVQPGMTVVFPRHVGQEVEPGLMLITESDVLGVVAKVVGVTGGGTEILVPVMDGT